MTVFFILCFTAPNLPMAGKILYIGAIYIFYGMSSTMYQVPYGSLSSVMSTSSQDYAVLGTFRDYGANISGTVVNAIAVSLIMFFGGSMNSTAAASCLLQSASASSPAAACLSASSAPGSTFGSTRNPFPSRTDSRHSRPTAPARSSAL